ncbi:MAG: HAMP domain-containing histidine kinase [Chloroflexota bacterium]|nr:HAMP domain-containing histidine kinase [Chloroflexota bacterium]
MQTSKVMETMIDLARLAQRASVVMPDMIARELLEQLLTFCSAQRGAVLLTSYPLPLVNRGQPLAPASSSSKSQALRTLALHDIAEEEVQTLLTALPPVDGAAPATARETCWITYRLPLGEVTVESLRSSIPPVLKPEAALAPTPTSQSVQALLIIGWTNLANSPCPTMFEQGYTSLPLIADAIGAVIVSILLAERARDLKIAMTRAALEEAERLKAELIGTVNHELRTPLAAIKGYAATLLRHERRLTHDERHEFLLTINEASDRLEVIIERLLEMSELEAGSIRINNVPVDLAHLALEAMAFAEQQGSKQESERFTFTLRLEDAGGQPAKTVPPILGDPRRLHEVLHNLLENAMKYSPNGGGIAIVLRPIMSQEVYSPGLIGLHPADVPAGEEHLPPPSPQVRPMLEVRVQDSGMGIPAEHLERIFERFHRVDTRLTREVNGLGLGLAICKGIVSLHHGIIWAESEAGNGSIFHVWLPVAEISE